MNAWIFTMSSGKKSWNSSLRPRSPRREADIASGKHKQAVRKGFQKLTLEQVRAKEKAVQQKLLAKGKTQLVLGMNKEHKPKALKKASVLQSLDAQLVTLHGQVVRLRAMNEEGFVVCFICGKWVPYEASEAMHYQGRKERGTRFSDIGVQAGCHDCNSKPNGDRKNFARKLNEKYGEGTSSRMDNLSKQVQHFDRMWYCNRIGELEIEKEQLLKQ